MLSFRKAGLCDENFVSERRSFNPVNNTERLASIHPKHYNKRSTFSSITGLVRRSFPRPFRGKGERNNVLSGFRSSMRNGSTIDEVAKVTKQSSAESSHVMKTSLGPHRSDVATPLVSTGSLFDRSLSKGSTICSTQTSSCTSMSSPTCSLRQVKQLDHDTDCDIDVASMTKNDILPEMEMLEDLLKASSMSPTKLVSRNFPLTSTHGSSLGSMNSDMSSNYVEDQSSSNYDNFYSNETHTAVDDHIIPSTGGVINEKNILSKEESTPVSSVQSNVMHVAGPR